MKKTAPNSQKLPRKRNGKLQVIDGGILADRAPLGMTTLLPADLCGVLISFDGASALMLDLRHFAFLRKS
jgi:hypothetical protein